MPSRRKFLAGVSTVSAAGMVGCLDTSEQITGHVLRKSIDAEVTGDSGRTTRTGLLNVLFEKNENFLHGSYDPEYVGSALDEGFVTVSDDLHETLSNQFQNVRYSVNVNTTAGDKTPVNAAATQADFNDLTLGGRATVSTRWGEDGVGYVRVHNTEPRSQAVSDSNIRTSDLDETINSE